MRKCDKATKRQSVRIFKCKIIFVKVSEMFQKSGTSYQRMGSFVTKCQKGSKISQRLAQIIWMNSLLTISGFQFTKILRFFRDITNPDHSTWPSSKFGLFIKIWDESIYEDFINDVSLFKGHLDEVKPLLLLMLFSCDSFSNNFFTAQVAFKFSDQRSFCPQREIQDWST